MKKKIKISLVTTGRMDWSYCEPLCRELSNRKEVELHLLVTGTHLIKDRGYTIEEIIKDGYTPSAEILMNVAGDNSSSISKSIGLGVLSFAEEFQRNRPDILIVNGDRFETLAAVMAAHPYNIVIAHIGGGEVTEGVIDENIRHAITKMSHLHFTECEKYRKRIIQLGEDKNKVFNAGSLSIETMKKIKLKSLSELEDILKVKIPDNFLLVTFHPVTLVDRKQNKKYITNFLTALNRFGMFSLFTYPNVDNNNSVIIEAIKNYVKTNPEKSALIASGGKENYFSLMKLCKAVVGNSSSGIMETPFYNTPTVNIGERQEGRVKAENIIDSSYNVNDIVESLKVATSERFSNKIRQMKDPFYKENISNDIIKNLLTSYKNNSNLIIKKFYDIKNI